MAANFPSSPTDGQTYTYNSVVYYYDSGNTSWVSTYIPPASVNLLSVNVSTSGPTGNNNGTLWWNSNTGKLLVYYTDADSSQWVDAFTTSLTPSGVTASIYGGTTNMPVLAIDTYGRITSASNVDITSVYYAFANTVGVRANTFANTVGVNANTWSNAVGVNANTYANATFYTSTNGSAAFAKANTSVQNNTTTLITTGYSVSSYNAGTNVAAYGTWTPDPANGNYQYANSNGAVTIAVPTNNCAIDILFTNGLGGAGSGAGAITFSGYTAPSGGGGDTYATTANNRFILMIRKINGIATYSWKALQ